MDYQHLGRSGVRVSRLCLGTMNFGPETSEPDAFRILDRALEHGINFVDTANVYGRKPGEGVTEQIVGRWLAQGGNRRDKVVLATKVYGEMGKWPNQARLSALHLRRACDESLRRLRTDHLDLYQMHHIDRATPWEEIWQALELLVAQGKVIYVGSSNFAGWHLARACETARQRHFFGLVSEQSKYSLIERTVELEVIPACQEYGLGLLPWSPLGSGALAGAQRRGPEGSSSRREGRFGREVSERHATRLEAFVRLCGTLGEEPANVALAWLLSRPAVTAPIIGPRTVEQLDGSLRALELRLDAATLAKLDEIFPGPGKPAPEAYAW
jgi:aryl-alcohol dehydrogenase-like predicted oxidoreductase